MDSGLVMQESAGKGERRLGRSLLALFAGFVVGFVLSLGTDMGLHAIGLFPALGQPMTDALLLIATGYRTVYAVISSYVIARLAPNRPMGHALISGVLGVIVCTVGALVTWNSGLGPHWYPVALIVLALPPAWLGGRLRVMQLRSRDSD